MTHGEEQARRAARMAEMIAATGYERGDSRPPVFGEQIMGIWAGESNPQRIGRYVETRRRTGFMNPGVWYRLTDGRGSFWQYEASQTLFVPEQPTQETPAGYDPHDHTHTAYMRGQETPAIPLVLHHTFEPHKGLQMCTPDCPACEFQRTGSTANR